LRLEIAAVSLERLENPVVLPNCCRASNTLHRRDYNMADTEMELNSGIAAFETKQFARAMQLLGPLADAGNVDAQYRMAIMMQNGLGMVKNELQAYRYMRNAAEAGHALAQHGLGFMYLEGDCTSQNYRAAADWFRKAAEQGLAGSQTTLASLYEQGLGVEKDQAEAQRWYKMAGF
jgi:TPR repeat protein